jgi:hypothetical protein
MKCVKGISVKDYFWFVFRLWSYFEPWAKSEDNSSNSRTEFIVTVSFACILPRLLLPLPTHKSHYKVNYVYMLIKVTSRVSVYWNQRDALFIQFIENQEPPHVSSIACLSSGVAAQTAFGVLRAYNVSWLWHDCTANWYWCHNWEDHNVMLMWAGPRETRWCKLWEVTVCFPEESEVRNQENRCPRSDNESILWSDNMLVDLLFVISGGAVWTELGYYCSGC